MKYEKSILDAHGLEVFIISLLKGKESGGKTCFLGFGIRRVAG